MRAVNYMREEIARVGLQSRLTIEARRLLTRAAKTAVKRGDNPRSAIGRLLQSMK